MLGHFRMSDRLDAIEADIPDMFKAAPYQLRAGQPSDGFKPCLQCPELIDGRFSPSPRMSDEA